MKPVSQAVAVGYYFENSIHEKVSKMSQSVHRNFQFPHELKSFGMLLFEYVQKHLCNTSCLNVVYCVSSSLSFFNSRPGLYFVRHQRLQPQMS